jgi:hypothetical protein
MHTILNILGPLTNPRAPSDGRLPCRPGGHQARVLKMLGSRHVLVHGHEGARRITITGPTFIARQARLHHRVQHQAEAVKVDVAPIRAIKVKDAAESRCAGGNGLDQPGASATSWAQAPPRRSVSEGRAEPVGWRGARARRAVDNAARQLDQLAGSPAASPGRPDATC